MRLIDAEELDEKAVQFPNTSVWVPIEAVWDTPTIDAVEVIRCKDCKYFLNGLVCNVLSDPSLPFGFDVCMNGNDFCSYGERKEADGNG